MAARTKFDLYAFTSGLGMNKAEIELYEFEIIDMLMRERLVAYDETHACLQLLHSTEAKNAIIAFFHN